MSVSVVGVLAGSVTSPLALLSIMVLLWSNKMPRKSSNKSEVVPPQPHVQPYALPDKAEWGGFINVRLSDEQRLEFKEWAHANARNVPALYIDMLGNGLKITHSYDHIHNCFILSVTGALVGDDRARRYVSTSRAGDLNEVIALTVWKHEVLARGDYGNYRPHDSAFLSWG